MRLLFLTNFYPPHAIGGYEQWSQEVAEGLLQHGHSITVLTSNYGMQADAVPQHEGGVLVMRTLHLESDLNYYRPLEFFLQRPSRQAENRQQLRRAIDQTRPDALVVWGMWNLSLTLPYWAEEWLPGRVVYYLCSYWPSDLDPHRAYWQLPANRRLTSWLKRPFRQLALAQLARQGYPPTLQFEHAICCSRYVRDQLVRAGKLPVNAGVLFGGTDPQPFLAEAAQRNQADDAPLRLLYFGRLIEDKGVRTAIEALGKLALDKLAMSSRQVCLTILGSGHPDYEALLRARAVELGVSQQIEFVRQIPRQDVPAWLARHDVYLFTSTWPEPMARTVMEAMAAGLLVIGTTVGGQAEMLCEGENALTFAANDAAGLAAQIERVLASPELAQRLASAGQALVLEKFTLQRMVCDFEQYLEAVV